MPDGTTPSGAEEGGFPAAAHIVVVHIGNLLEPRDKAIAKATGRRRALASVLVVLFLLLLPLQFVLGQRVLQTSLRDILA